MAAEFDTQPEYEEEEREDPREEDEPRDRGFWGALALLVLIVLIVLILLSQCTARVPDVVGESRTKAEAMLVNVGLKLGDVSEVATSQVEAGLVAEQFPMAGALLRKGTPVDLSVALGGNLVTVPNVVGLDSANAAIQLQQAGFVPIPAEEYSDEVAEGIAIRQTPVGGSQAEKGSEVTVYYSLGPQDLSGVNVDHTDTNDGLTDANRDSTGTGNDPLKLYCTRVYPSAKAWSSGGDIYVRLTPGSAAQRVTSGTPWDTNPVISPSHKYVVFMRASAQNQRARTIGAVCFTSLKPYILAMPEVPMRYGRGRWVGPPVFAPTANSKTPNSDWIVFAQYWNESYISGKQQPSARLIVCNVPMDSKWVSWNWKLRPSGTILLSKSSKAGCVRVRQYKEGKRTYSRNFNAWTGLYLR